MPITTKVVSSNPVHGEVYYNTTDPGSFKLTDISYRLRFSFVSFACIIRSFSVRSRLVCVIGSFISCIVRFVYLFVSCNFHFVYRSFRVSFVSLCTHSNFFRVKNKINCALTIHKTIKIYTHWKHSNGHMRKVRRCPTLPDWTILLIVLRENIFNKCIFFNNILYRQINKKSSTCVTSICM